MSDFASQVSEKEHNEVSDFVPFEVSDFAKSVSEKVLFSVGDCVRPRSMRSAPGWRAKGQVPGVG